jgi:hypothetical protein
MPVSGGDSAAMVPGRGSFLSSAVAGAAISCYSMKRKINLSESSVDGRSEKGHQDSYMLIVSVSIPR